MSGWTVHRLSELCDLRAGSAFKVHMQGRRQGDLPFIKVSDMNNVENEIGIRSANNWISMEDLATLKAKPLPPGTTVFAKIGEALRQNRVRLLSRPTIVDNNMMGAVPRLNAVDARFLYYRLSAFDLASTANGTALPYITVFVLGNVTFAIPPLPTQRRIADILSAYDDLIELNQRRIAILEEMARRLFEEWFVRFRYPGGEGANIVESSLGPIPSDWNVEKLEVLCERITDGSHWSPPTTAPGRFMASVKDMREWGFDLSSCRRICEEDFENLIRNDCQPRVGDILVAKDGANLNKHTFLVTEQLDLVVLSSVAIIRPKPEVPGEFLVGLLRSDAVSERIKRSASGAAIPRIVLKDFRRLEIVSPPDKIRRLWALRSAPLHELCRKLTGQNTRLRAARDLLLPKLISGEIDVSAAPAPDDAARDAA